MPTKKQNQRSAAAKRGWATRKRNARKAEAEQLRTKRSAAAKRGWATRKRKRKSTSKPNRNYLVSLRFSRGNDRRPLHVEAIMIGKSLAQIKRQLESGDIDAENFVFVEWWHGKKPPSRTSRDQHDFDVFLAIATLPPSIRGVKHSSGKLYR